MEIFTGCPNRSADSEHQSKKMGVVRSRFEKNAIRVCGDWSEQLSSKGKIYFYNCITEVSQWQKPSEWNLPDLEHSELIKVLNQRDSLDSSVVKRPRLMCNAAGAVKKDEVEVQRVSPRRSKAYDHVDGEKRYMVEDRVCMQRNVCGYAPKNRPPMHHRAYRESPKPDCNGASHYTSQFSNTSNVHAKRNPSIPLQRSAPADDMEISPNSSPMSAGSSPLGYGNSHSPRRIKCRTGAPPRVLRRAACSEVKHPSSENADKPSNSHTLRQLLDAIRDSIGGLLDQSPCSTSNQKTRTPSSANGLHFKQTPNEKMSSSTHTSRNFDQIAKASSVRTGRLPTVEFPDDAYLDSQGTSIVQPHISPAPSSDRLNVKDKSVSGLVSTLSTLVNLIGTRNSNTGAGDGTSAHTPTQTSSYRQSFTKPHLLQHRFGHQQVVSSPLTPSPATPSATTGASSGGGSSGGALANSISSAGTFGSIQQQDDSMSGPDRVGATKFRTSASTSSHDLSSPCNIQGSVSPSRPSGLEISDGHRLVPHIRDSISTDEHSQERQKSVVEGTTAMDYSQSDKEFRTRGPNRRYTSTGSPAISSASRASGAGGSRQYSPSTSQSTTYKSPSSVNHRDSIVASVEKRCERSRSPDKLYPSLEAAETLIYVDSNLSHRYRDIGTERLEMEAQIEAKRFDRLHSVLYGELSAESKTLRALVRISEAKLALHKEKQTSLQDLMDTIECHRQLPNPTFPDDVL